MRIIRSFCVLGIILGICIITDCSDYALDEKPADEGPENPVDECVYGEPVELTCDGTYPYNIHFATPIKLSSEEIPSDSITNHIIIDYFNSDNHRDIAIIYTSYEEGKSGIAFFFGNGKGGFIYQNRHEINGRDLLRGGPVGLLRRPCPADVGPRALQRGGPLRPAGSEHGAADAGGLPLLSRGQRSGANHIGAESGSSRAQTVR